MSPSSVTIADLQRISGAELSAHVLAAHPSLAIIDVRGSDHVGGHIRGSTHASSSTLDWRMPELARELRGKEVVVFHCMLSQERGPAAALRYLREREKLVAKKDGEEQKEQQVYVLEGGFVKWQEKYGEDERLTEAFAKDIWEYGY